MFGNWDWSVKLVIGFRASDLKKGVFGITVSTNYAFVKLVI